MHDLRKRSCENGGTEPQRGVAGALVVQVQLAVAVEAALDSQAQKWKPLKARLLCLCPLPT